MSGVQRDDAAEPDDLRDAPSDSPYPDDEDLGASRLEGGSGRPGDATTEQIFAQAIGGWRGIIDSAVPSGLFLITFVVSGQQLRPALIAAVAAGLVIAVIRLARKQSLQQVLAGFIGVAFCAWWASRTGNAEDFYLPGLLINAAYGTALATSCLVGHPALGYFVGAATGDFTGWRRVPEQRRAYALATWILVAMFALRLIVQVPLYLAGAVVALGTVKIFMQWPLYALTAYLAYRVIATARRDAPIPARED